MGQSVQAAVPKLGKQLAFVRLPTANPLPHPGQPDLVTNRPPQSFAQLYARAGTLKHPSTTDARVPEGRFVRRRRRGPILQLQRGDRRRAPASVAARDTRRTDLASALQHDRDFVLQRDNYRHRG